jgi:hypothetical protein
MVQIPIAYGSYKRDYGFLPNLRLRNLIVEPTKADDEGVVLLPRPGLKISMALGPVPIAAVWGDAGLFGGKTVALAGSTCYLGSSSFGALTTNASAKTRFAASGVEMVFCSGGVLYRTDGVTLTQPAVLWTGPVVAVAYMNGYFFAAIGGTQQVYYSAPGNGSSWPALNFSSESHSGLMLDLMTINDQLVLFAQNSVEFWQPNPTGDANLPFTRIDGLTYSKGILNTCAAAYADNTVIWVGNDGSVYRRGSVPQRISDHGIEEQIKASSAAYLFSFNWTGHTLLVLTLDAATYFFDFETKEWLEATSIGRLGWRAKCGYANGINTILGDSVTGNLLAFDDATLTDVGDLIERRFTAMIPDQVEINNITLDAQSGIGSEPNGAPIIIEMSISRDGSQAFSEFIQADLGRRGEYRKRALWRRLGRYDMGAILDFRTTDPSPFTIQSVRMNENLSGRSI